MSIWEEHACMSVPYIAKGINKTRVIISVSLFYLFLSKLSSLQLWKIRLISYTHQPTTIYQIVKLYLSSVIIKFQDSTSPLNSHSISSKFYTFKFYGK